MEPISQHNIRESLAVNNTVFPGIMRIEYRLKTEDMKNVVGEDGKPVSEKYVGRDGVERERLKKEAVKCRPVLTTIVWFADGTSVRVMNAENEPVQTETVMLGPQGEFVDDESKAVEKVVVATRASKELGFVYAVFKRLVGVPKNDKVCDGVGRAIEKFVDSSVDPLIDQAKKRIDQANKKAAAEKKAAEKKAKPRRWTVDDIVQALGPLADKIASDDGIIDKIRTIFKD